MGTNGFSSSMLTVALQRSLITDAMACNTPWVAPLAAAAPWQASAIWGTRPASDFYDGPYVAYVLDAADRPTPLIN